MAEADRKLHQIAAKVSLLDKSSDEINDMIAAFEEKLAKMNIGIEEGKKHAETFL